MTAALAAAAGAVGFSHSSLASPTPANSAVNMAALNATMGDSQLSAVTTARIERRQLATRDSSRVELAPSPAHKRQALAARTAKARAAKLDAYRRQALHQADVLAALKAKRLKAQAANRLVLPLSEYRITATFGQGGQRWAKNHTGLDMAAPIGTRIGVAMRGTVTSVEYAGSYGRRVIVTHEDGTETWYCHMAEYTVEVGDTVYAGDQVGSVGMSGNTSGPHLHFEVHPDGGDAVDPVPWFRDHGKPVT